MTSSAYSRDSPNAVTEPEDAENQVPPVEPTSKPGYSSTSAVLMADWSSGRAASMRCCCSCAVPEEDTGILIRSALPPPQMQEISRVQVVTSAGRPRMASMLTCRRAGSIKNPQWQMQRCAQLPTTAQKQLSRRRLIR